jgi:hypothetical protein
MAVNRCRPQPAQKQRKANKKPDDIPTPPLADEMHGHTSASEFSIKRTTRIEEHDMNVVSPSLQALG